MWLLYEMIYLCQIPHRCPFLTVSNDWTSPVNWPICPWLGAHRALTEPCCHLYRKRRVPCTSHLSLWQAQVVWSIPVLSVPRKSLKPGGSNGTCPLSHPWNALGAAQWHSLFWGHWAQLGTSTVHVGQPGRLQILWGTHRRQLWCMLPNWLLDSYHYDGYLATIIVPTYSEGHASPPEGWPSPGVPLVPSGPGTPCWFAQTTGIVLGCLWDCAWLCPPHGPQAKGTTCWGHVHVGKACMQFAYCLKLLMSLITSQAKRFHDHSNGCSGANSIGHWKWTPGWQVWAHVHLVRQVHRLLGCP